MSAAIRVDSAVAQARVLAAGATALGLNLTQEQQQMLLIYLTMMQKWNRVYNLTAIREPERMISHHLLDSLGVAPHLKTGNVLDAGSGAGLPGIPLAIALPDLTITMLDSNQKKTAFVQQVITELRLKNARVVTARVETWRAARSFDVIISRAFADLADFTARTAHLLAPGGVFVAMKGQRPDTEIAGLPGTLTVRSVPRLVIPGLDAQRHLVFIQASQAV